MGKVHSIEITVSWQDASNGQIPDMAISTGDCYVARALLNGEYIPGRVVEEEKCAYIVHGNTEKNNVKYQVLVNTSAFNRPAYQWVATNGKGLPNGYPLVAGSHEGQPLYIGRARIDGENGNKLLYSGQYVPEKKAVIISYKGVVGSNNDCEVLCYENWYN